MPVTLGWSQDGNNVKAQLGALSTHSANQTSSRHIRFQRQVMEMQEIMNSSVPPWKQNSASPRKWFLRALASVLSLIMMIYGVIVIETGVVNFRGAGNAEVVAKRSALVEAADEGRPLEAPSEIASHSSVGIALLGLITSPTFAYGSQGLGDQLLHYATMPRFNGISLSLHNLMAGSCMLFGALQFWPVLRRRYPRLHRAMGGYYLVTAQLAMVGALGYMLRTPVEKIYDQLTFYVELWVLAISVTFSLWAAMYALRKKHIAQHQAWMTVSYAMLLTAPIGRIGWFIFAAVAPDMRQLEANYAVSDPLIPLCILCGYGIFTVNRWIQAERTDQSATKIAQEFNFQMKSGRMLAWFALIAVLASFWTTIEHFLLSPGFSSMALAEGFIPQGVIQARDGIIATQTETRLIFFVAMMLGLASGAHFLWRVFLDQGTDPQIPGATAWFLALSSGVAGSIYLSWGWQIGMPSFAKLTGGAMHVFGGLAIIGFAGLLVWALRTRQSAWVKEWAVFTVASLLSVPGFYWFLPVLATLDIDAQFIQSGHVYRLACNSPWMLYLTLAYVAAMYSQATHSRIAR